MVTRIQIRPEITPSNGAVSSGLEGNPPIRTDESLFTQPVRNDLLASGGFAGLPQLGSELGLGAASDIDGALKRSNVSFLHEHAKYTNTFVRATTVFVCDNNKEACTVLDMTSHARKLAKLPVAAPKAHAKKKKVAKPGQDGKTLGQRLELAMAYESGRRGHEYRQIDLLDDVNRLAKAPSDSPVLTQQGLSAIMLNTVTRSAYSHLMAAACHVNPIWLAEGAGGMTD